MPELTTEPKKISRTSTHQPVEVTVTLSTEDYKKAIWAAKLSNETVPEWISSLVNIALKP